MGWHSKAVSGCINTDIQMTVQVYCNLFRELWFGGAVYVSVICVLFTGKKFLIQRKVPIQGLCVVAWKRGAWRTLEAVNEQGSLSKKR